MADNRENPRKKCVLSITFQTDDKSCYSGSVLDISSGGVLIDTDAELFVGQHLTLNIDYLSVKEKFSVSGKVINITENGTGIKFDGLSSNQRNAVSFLWWQSIACSFLGFAIARDDAEIDDDVRPAVIH